MTTFERFFIEDKKTHKENTGAYYKLISERAICEKILRDFGLDPANAKILNGHVPVKFKDGESPVKGEGLLFVIDGGMSKSYQKKTGIAGYTFIFNSRFMALAEHKPYRPIAADGSQDFFTPTIKTVEMLKGRMMIRDTDKGKELMKKIGDLEDLVAAYRSGQLEEVFNFFSISFNRSSFADEKNVWPKSSHILPYCSKYLKCFVFANKYSCCRSGSAVDRKSVV